jgi:osmoprotectant transport system ATP-binding protein
MGYVIQDVGLLPHWTVGRNVGLVPRLQRWDSARIASRIDEMLRSVGLDPAVFRDRYPRHLSGGQRQRVGVARALAADPEIVLMDEPFGALDPITRGELQNEFLRLQSMIRKTVVLVTHDMFEAVRLSDHLAIMREGRIEQIGPPGEVIDRPSTPFAERFVGEHRDALRLSMRKRSAKESA